MNLRSVDLNLLLVLEALFAERSVTRAAASLGLSQPAASHALRRLRELFGDPLFVRGPQGLRPTARAEAMGAPLALALQVLRRTLSEPPPFDPAASHRRFTLAATDLAQVTLLPPLLGALARGAPGISVLVRPVPAEETERLLAEGELDLALALPGPDRPGLYRQALFEERFVCVLRKGHPAARRRLTLDRFCALPHLLVAPRGAPGGLVDSSLAELGRTRRVTLTVSQFLVAPHVVAHSDLAWTAPTRIAKAYARLLPLVLRPVPLPLGGFTLAQLWHERQHRDPAHLWFRARLAEVAKGT
ncbi:MAG: LysR family transcriptional regulator [Deltaproteobacteria bacterium]|nr:LysR family transcriptional regulator [Deltaproteobacteria bacterium]